MKTKADWKQLIHAEVGDVAKKYRSAAPLYLALGFIGCAEARRGLRVHTMRQVASSPRFQAADSQQFMMSLVLGLNYHEVEELARKRQRVSEQIITAYGMQRIMYEDGLLASTKKMMTRQPHLAKDDIYPKMEGCINQAASMRTCDYETGKEQVYKQSDSEIHEQRREFIWGALCYVIDNAKGMQTIRV